MIEVDEGTPELREETEKKLRKAIETAQRLGINLINLLSMRYRGRELLGCCVLGATLLPVSPRLYGHHDFPSILRLASARLGISYEQAGAIGAGWDGQSSLHCPWRRLGDKLREEFNPVCFGYY